ncbi:hypothetical protein SNEBB_009729 [Seison nebaliae]|nr:hypothetical protein SNEBB_009729 [Seison nebaliae]
MSYHLPESKCFLDLYRDGQPFGRLVFELFKDIVPMTCSNFTSLCCGSKGYGYRGSTFHKYTEGYVQGGDITNFDGTGGLSIYGNTFIDESFDVHHGQPYLVGMANKGIPHSNSSQFYITTMPMPWLNYRNVVFAKVIEGQELVDTMIEVNTRHEKNVKFSIVKGGEIRANEEEELDDDSIF